MGVLFIKSMALAEEVYMAMQARCYTGEAVYFRQFQLHKGDWAWLVGLLIFIGFAVMGKFWLGKRLVFELAGFLLPTIQVSPCSRILALPLSLGRK